MEAQDPLSQLADIHLPGDVSAWPPAIGWWLLLVLILAGIAYLIHLMLLKALQKRRLSFVISELDRIYNVYSKDSKIDTKVNSAGLKFVNEVNSIVRRVCLVTFPNNDQIAELNGTAWLIFLDKTDNSTQFSIGPGSDLGDALYQRSYSGDADALYHLVSQWIKKCYTHKITLIDPPNAHKVQEVLND